jgi:uracil-DNA glycosylase family 4
VKSPGVPTEAVPTTHPAPPADHPVVVLVGQNPGTLEDQTNRPFVGPSGTLVREVYITPLLPRAHVYLTNAARCATAPEVDPPAKSFRQCIGHTVADLRLIRAAHPTSPIFVLALGAHAARHLHAALAGQGLSLKASLTKQGTPCKLESETGLSTSSPSNSTKSSTKKRTKKQSSPSETATSASLFLPTSTSENSTASSSDSSLAPSAATAESRDGGTVNLFSTYHPAYVLRDRKFIYAVDRHIQLLCRHIDGNAPVPSVPGMVEVRRPLPDDTRVGAIDIETYGLFDEDFDGTPLPPQTVFHPQRSLYTDGVPIGRMIRTVSITLCPDAEPGTADPDALSPGETMVFHLWDVDHRLMLHAWLRHLRHLYLMNAVFDILYLRRLGYRISEHTHFISDLQHFIYLWDETCSERSLKSIGPVIGTHVYGDKLRFKRPCEDADSYNGQDTHNTLLSCQTIARLIAQRYPGTAKLSADCLSFYNENIWTVVCMAEAGIPYSRHRLARTAVRYHRHTSNILRILAEQFHLQLEGEGSQKAKDAFLQEHLDYLQLNDHPMLIRTEKQHKPSFNEENRNLLSSKYQELLDATDDEHLWSTYRRILFCLRLITVYGYKRKVLSSYLVPLLLHRINKPDDRRSVTIPITLGGNPCSPPAPPPLLPTGTGSSAPLLPSPSSPSSPLLLLSACCPPSSPTPSPSPSGSLARSTTGDAPLGPTTFLSGSDLALAFGTWYITPSPEKDSSGDEGGTKQGRIVIKHPAEQTSPPDVQRCRASRYGADGSIVTLDLEQIELKVPTIMSGDKGMLAEYLKPKPDIHTDMTVRLFGPDIIHHPHFKKGGPEDPRQWGKPANFLILYRGGADRMQASVLAASGKLLSLDFCQQVVAKFPLERAGLWSWQRSIIREAVGCHRWVSSTGRTLTDWVDGDPPPWEQLHSPRTERWNRQLQAPGAGLLHLPFTGQSRLFLGGKYEVNEIVNFPVQTTAGNILLYFQALIRPLLHRTWRMFLNVYDAIYFDLPRCDVPALNDLLKSRLPTLPYWLRLCDHYGHSIPLTCSLKESHP